MGFNTPKHLLIIESKSSPGKLNLGLFGYFPRNLGFLELKKDSKQTRPPGPISSTESFQLVFLN